MPRGAAVVELTDPESPCSRGGHCGDYFGPIASLMGLRFSKWPVRGGSGAPAGVHNDLFAEYLRIENS